MDSFDYFEDIDSNFEDSLSRDGATRQRILGRREIGVSCEEKDRPKNLSNPSYFVTKFTIGAELVHALRLSKGTKVRIRQHREHRRLYIFQFNPPSHLIGRPLFGTENGKQLFFTEQQVCAQKLSLTACRIEQENLTKQLLAVCLPDESILPYIYLD